MMLQGITPVLMGGVAALAVSIFGPAALDRLFSTPPEPTLIFDNAAVTEVSNGKATIVYQMRRTESCETHIHVRWFNLDRGAFSAEHTLERSASRAPVTDRLEPFPLRVDVPDEPGTWGYMPIVTPGPDCAYQGEIQPPMVVVVVD